MPDIRNSAKANSLSVVLIVPDPARRRTLVKALPLSQVSIAREISGYPPPGEIAEIARLNLDVVIVDLDTNMEEALLVIENFGTRNPAMTVMAYCSCSDANTMRRSMQAGAREFLIEPLPPDMVNEAFARTAARQASQVKKAGKMLVFAPSKGGVGVTTIAANFALALTRESGAKVVAVDMDFQMGELALGLGMTTSFSVVDALLNPARLDRDFLNTLLVRHSLGLAILGSPEQFAFVHGEVDSGADKLFRTLREEFDYVVVDTGTCHGNIQEMLYRMADTLYLICEMSFPSLRNAHRMNSFLSRNDNRAVEVVLNRFSTRQSIDEEGATKAIGRSINWRIPNAYAAARAAQDSGVPLAMKDSPISRALVQMARAAAGKPLTPEKKASAGFNFFGLKTQGPVEA